jgi:hypothetical protein
MKSTVGNPKAASVPPSAIALEAIAIWKSTGTRKGATFSNPQGARKQKLAGESARDAETLAVRPRPRVVSPLLNAAARWVAPGVIGGLITAGVNRLRR